jgi:hypothetical protein
VKRSRSRSQSPAAEARKRFPGRDPRQASLRDAFLAIVTAAAKSGEAAEILASLRVTAYEDPAEIEDSLAGETVAEIVLHNVRPTLEEARRACRFAIQDLRRSRRRDRTHPRRPTLKVVS